MVQFKVGEFKMYHLERLMVANYRITLQFQKTPKTHIIKNYQ